VELDFRFHLYVNWNWTPISDFIYVWIGTWLQVHILFTCGIYEPIEVVVIYWDIVFRFIVEYSSLSDFGPKVIKIGLFFIWGVLKDDIWARVETWD
jgi:hypothetical protein